MDVSVEIICSRPRGLTVCHDKLWWTVCPTAPSHFKLARVVGTAIGFENVRVKIAVVIRVVVRVFLPSLWREWRE